MVQSVQLASNRDHELRALHVPKRLSTLKFFLRYPIFLLAFGPPQFKTRVVGIDTSQAHFSLWNVFQVGWLAAIAFRAIVRLATARSIFIPKQIRSVLKLMIILGLLFLASVAYSPGRVISAEYAFLYFLNLICMIEFVVDVYQEPPNWMQCIFQIRLVMLLLIAAVLVTLPLAPTMVMLYDPSAGVRLIGGSVAPMAVCPEFVAIISAYTFLNALESKFRSALLFLVGLTGTLITQARGAELSLFLVLTILVFGWAKMSLRSAYILVAALMAMTLVTGAVVGTIGGERIWRAFNRGQDFEGIVTASGRTGVWKSVIEYCITRPQGMGYIAGIRTFHRRDFATNLHASLTNIGGTDNSFMEVLADAGWLALALYLTMIAKTVALGWRSMKKLPSVNRAVDRASIDITHHSLSCALLLLMFCLAEGMEGSIFTIPMQGAFYCQNILIAMILGASASILIASRLQYPSVLK
jgi:hypothetical protein